MALSSKFIREAEPDPDKRVTKYRDSPNLYLWIKTPKHKYWTFRYSFGGRSRERSLGPVKKVSATQARKRAIELIEKLESGIDPFPNTRPSSEGKPYPLFHKAVEIYLEDDPKGWRDPKAPRQWRNTLKKNAYPIIEHKTLDEITNEDVFRILRPIWRDHFPTATKVRSRIELIWDYCVPRDNKLPNPARYEGYLKKKLPRQKKPEKHFRGLEWQDAPEFFREHKEIESEPARARMWSILTVTRSANTYRMNWSEIDHSRMVWTCPIDNNKGRTRYHQVPVLQEMLDFLGQRKSPRSPVFPNKRTGKHLSDAALLLVIKKMGYHHKTTVHGLRSTFTDWARNKPEPASRDLIDEVLTHRKPSSVYAAYARDNLLEQRRELHTEWAQFLGFIHNPHSLEFNADDPAPLPELSSTVTFRY